MILEILRTRNITPPSYKLFNLKVDTFVSAFLVEKIIKIFDKWYYIWYHIIKKGDESNCKLIR
jgi:hypothetical protein